MVNDGCELIAEICGSGSLLHGSGVLQGGKSVREVANELGVSQYSVIPAYAPT